MLRHRVQSNRALKTVKLGSSGVRMSMQVSTVLLDRDLNDKSAKL